MTPIHIDPDLVVTLSDYSEKSVEEAMEMILSVWAMKNGYFNILLNRQWEFE